MIKFSIPGFFTHRKLNEILLDLYTYEKPYVFKEDVKIDSIYDSFPGCYWNGGRINHKGAIPIEEIKEIIKEYTYKYKINMRLVFTNSLITNELLYDPLGNTILDLAPIGTGITINSEDLKEYIEKKYPEKFYFNWSATKILKTVDEINKYSKNNTTIPSFLDVNNNFKILNQLKYKDNIELIVDDLCLPHCPNYYQHYIEFSKKNLYNISVKPEICSCKQEHNYYIRRVGKSHSISPKDIEKKYQPLGFTHFKITGREDFDIQIIESYVRYLIRPKWQNYIRNELIEKLIYF